ncbi:MAG: hypothetical protein ACRD0N_07685 [Acidimicrobiales bacterium]
MRIVRAGALGSLRLARRLGTYRVVATVVAVPLLTQNWNRRWAGDIYLHAAAVAEVARHPLSPGNPLVAGDAADPEYSPYIVLLGAFTRVTGLDVFTTLRLAGVLALITLLVVVPWALDRLVDDRSAAPWFLVFTLVLWGWEPWRWSGYLNLNSIGFILPYPSVVGASLLLVGLALTRRLLKRPTPARGAVLGLLSGCLLLVHPFSSISMAVGAAALLLGGRRFGRSQARALAVAVAVAATVALSWPYFPVLKLLSEGSIYDPVHETLYDGIPVRTLLALPGVVTLWAAWRRDHLDPLALAFMGAVGIYAVGGLTGRESLARVLPLAMLAAHLSLAVATSRLVKDRSRRARSPLLAGAFGLLLVGVLGCVEALPNMVPPPLLPASLRSDPRAQSEVERMSVLASLEPGRTIATDIGLVNRAAPAFELKTVSAGFIEPFLEDRIQREQANTALFAAATPSGLRRSLLRRYDVSYVITTPGNPVLDEMAGRRFDLGGFLVVELRRPTR